jgi:hypothetical protein
MVDHGTPSSFRMFSTSAQKSPSNVAGVVLPLVL